GSLCGDTCFVLGCNDSSCSCNYPICVKD
uniref:Kalata-B12 n=1 Tax=Oldenlandia affinis TaxID=60225 RepID=KAB12_OLDAF|nr:RecName: Full=Kalata-B12 [Oldenlandia affinis]2KVX_A Chain A, Kalata-B12 [Oldenlandia affinis]